MKKAIDGLIDNDINAGKHLYFMKSKILPTAILAAFVLTSPTWADITLADNLTVTGSLTLTGSGAVQARAPLSATLSGAGVSGGAQSVLIWNPANANFLAGVEAEYDRELSFGEEGTGKILLGRNNALGGNDTVAIGRGNRMESSVVNAIAALGSEISESGNNSIAVGGSYLSGSSNVAMGGSTVIGNHSTALGGSEILAPYWDAVFSSFAAGAGTIEVKDDSIADYCVALGGGYIGELPGIGAADYVNSFAAGRASVRGSNSFAVTNAIVYGHNSFAAMKGNVTGNGSVAIGDGTRVLCDGAVALGSYNRGNVVVPVTSVSWSVRWNDADPLFELGNGTTSNARSNAVTVLKNGKTSLENKFWDSEHPLDHPGVAAGSADNTAQGVALQVKGHAVLEGKVTISQPQGDILMGVFGGDSQASAE